MFCDGQVVEADFEKGLMLYEKAIELGDRDALQGRAKTIKTIPPKEYQRISARIARQMEEQVESQKGA